MKKSFNLFSGTVIDHIGIRARNGTLPAKLADK